MMLENILPMCKVTCFSALASGKFCYLRVSSGAFECFRAATSCLHRLLQLHLEPISWGDLLDHLFQRDNYFGLHVLLASKPPAMMLGS